MLQTEGKAIKQKMVSISVHINHMRIAEAAIAFAAKALCQKPGGATDADLQAVTSCVVASVGLMLSEALIDTSSDEIIDLLCAGAKRISNDPVMMTELKKVVLEARQRN